MSSIGSSISNAFKAVTKPITSVASKIEKTAVSAGKSLSGYNTLEGVKSKAEGALQGLGKGLKQGVAGLEKGAKQINAKGVLTGLNAVSNLVNGHAATAPTAAPGDQQAPIIMTSSSPVGSGGSSMTLYLGIGAAVVAVLYFVMKRKRLAVGLVLGLCVSQARAASPFAGKLDLTPDATAFAARSFSAAPQTLAGLEKPLWSLQDHGYTALSVAPLVGWESAAGNNRVLGGLDVGAPLGPLANILEAVGSIQALPPSVSALDNVLSHVSTGIILAWDPRYIAPAFIGYKVGVSFGGK